MNFEAVIDRIIEREQGYVDHPTTGADRRTGASPWPWPAQRLPRPDAGRCRWRWRARSTASATSRAGLRPGGLIDAAIGSELIDTGVNMGPARAARCCSAGSTASTSAARATPTCSSTARIGEISLDALRQYLRWRGAEGSDVMVAR
jgi:lysozyme family protein